MKIALGSSLLGEECSQLKEKIIIYLKKENIEYINCLSPIKESSANPLIDMQKAAFMVKNNEAHKAICICRSGTSAVNAALNAGIEITDIAKQATLLSSPLHNKLVLTTGYLFDWDVTKKHLDSFIKKSGDEENRTPVL